MTSPSTSDLAYWTVYFADRMTIVLDDPDVHWNARREWLTECLTDLRDMAVQTGTLTPECQAHAQALAEAQHAFIFHDGPDPDDDPQFAEEA